MRRWLGALACGSAALYRRQVSLRLARRCSLRSSRFATTWGSRCGADAGMQLLVGEKHRPSRACERPGVHPCYEVFLSPDGKSARMFITHESDPAAVDGIKRVEGRERMQENSFGEDA
jgi:hypothetical protein